MQGPELSAFLAKRMARAKPLGQEGGLQRGSKNSGVVKAKGGK